MAQLWLQGEGEEWSILPLQDAAYWLDVVPPQPLPFDSLGGGEGTRLVRANSEGTVFWAVVAPPGATVRINGEPLYLGVRVLTDRDAIGVGRGRMAFFSNESLAAIEPLSATDREVHCPRCRQLIVSGTAAVRCPQCGLWHHQSAELPCWTYSPTCALCDQSSALDAGFRWTPEEL